ncbi:hypothetical protein PGTUg99_024560 [Puccinia graminis f. sp. tritici]|uniref:Uncharacterized protein n=1 Tax=Puccinia graminis f. sp. tritici TaxID=56615 RepID=A0A5B0M9N6_PUCGR|nr:hypothetical protein PGTUg99_024560 [Puccinia graminis f. sp. tritici]
MRAGAWIAPSDPNCHQVLLQSLCNRHEGRMELQIKNQDDRLFFSEKHFAYCRLGTRKGSVLDQDSFVEYLKNNKSIDLLLDYDKFYEHELDEEERQGIDSVSRHHAVQSRTSEILESQPSTPSVTSTFPTSISRGNSTNPIVQAPLPNGISTTDMSTSITPATNCIEPMVIMQKLPPWISMHILDPNDLTWDRFGTPGRSSIFRGKPDVGWTDGSQAIELKAKDSSPISRTPRRLTWRSSQPDCQDTEAIDLEVIPARLPGHPGDGAGLPYRLIAWVSWQLGWVDLQLNRLGILEIARVSWQSGWSLCPVDSLVSGL